MHLEFRVKPINDKKDTYWTAPYEFSYKNSHKNKSVSEVWKA